MASCAILFEGGEDMALRIELQKRIERKQAEIREHEEAIRMAQAYIQGLQDTLKLIPKEDEFGQVSTAFRHGSNVAKARDALQAAGRPMHISDILKAMGQPADKKHRLALAGSIASYARKDQVFKKTAPNTFGLLEFDVNESEQALSDEAVAGFADVLTGIGGTRAK